MIDKDEYPQTAAVETRCWTMLADLWHAPDPRAHDRDVDHRLVRGGDARRAGAQAPLAARAPRRRQVDGPAEPRACPARCRSAGRSSATTSRSRRATSRSRWEHKVLDGYELEKYVDENTIGVVAIMGVTYTGMYEPVEQIAEALDRDPGVDGPRRPDPRRRRVRRDDRAVRAAGPGVGLPRRAGRLDQHLGPQVRPRLPRARLGGVARRRVAARGPRLPGVATSAATCRRSR